MKLPIARIIFAPLKHRYKGLITDGASQQRTIWIDPRQQYPARTLLHEFTHVMNPSWSETKVARETNRQWKRLNWREKAGLYKRLAQARLERDDK